MKRFEFKRSAIGRKLVIGVIVFSSMLTLLLTSYQLFREYRRDVNAINRELTQLRNTHVRPLTAAVWELNARQIAELLDGIVEIPGVEYAVVHTTSERLGESGTPTDEAPITERFSLDHEGETLGVLEVFANLSAVYSRLIDRLSVLLISNAIKTFFVALFVTAFVSYMFVRHLEAMAAFVRSRATAPRGERFELKRASARSSRDELDEVADAINEMTSHIEHSHAKLEREVAARTRDLGVALERATEASEAKASFLAAMSHEIRTPMNGVIGMIDLVMRTQLTDDQRRMLTTIKDSSFSLLKIINDILDFSKIDAGKMTLERIPLSIRDVIGGVADTLLPDAAKKGLDVLCFTDPCIPALVLGDQVRVRQILFNLCGNAVKFTNEGRVIIRADLVDSERDRATIRYEVIDQGIGIPPDKIPGLFKAFSQADFSTTRKFGGTGLGLSICKKLTDLMDGEIGVESEPDVGSTFWFTLTHAIDAHSGDTDIVATLQGIRALIVTGDTDRRAFMQSYLQRWQVEVDTLADPAGLGALLCEAANSDKPFDVVIQGQDWAEEERRACRESVQSDPALSSIRFVELCNRQDSAGLAAIGNTVTLAASPLRRGQMLQAVAIAVGRASPEVSYKEEGNEAEAASAAPTPTVEAAAARGELILVAEDNQVNQDVIRRQLGVLGYAADIEPDGKAAFNAWQRKNYAVLLTDCHMPEMDGYELTAAIRAAEAGTDKRFPIIAITANALRGEAESCLEAGMDDYLSKPLQMRTLKRMLGKWMPERADEGGDGAAESPVPAVLCELEAADRDRAIDLSFLIECFGDDEEIHRDILQEFAGTTPAYVKDIGAVVAEGREASEVASLAHAFKSAARTVGAHELADLCQSLEYAGKADDWTTINSLAPKLQPAMNKVSTFIAGFGSLREGSLNTGHSADRTGS